MKELALYLVSVYLRIGITIAVYGTRERHLQNKKRKYLLHTFSELIVVFLIAVMIRPFILYTRK